MNQVIILMTARLANYPSIVRSFNGIVLLSRNLVSVQNAISSAWESGCIRAIFELFGAILADRCAEDEADDGSAPSIRKLMSETPDNFNFYEKLFTSCQQFFSNLSVHAGKNSDLAIKIFKLFWDDLPFNSIKMWLSNTPVENAIPILLLIDNLIAVSQENCGKLASTKNGQLFIQYILERSDKWLVMQNDMYSNLLSHIITLTVQNGYATVIVRRSLEGQTLLTPEQTYTLLKLLNVGITLALEPQTTEKFVDFESVVGPDSDPLDEFVQAANTPHIPTIQKVLAWPLELEKTFFDDLFSIFEMVKKEAVPLIKAAPKPEETASGNVSYSEDHLKLVTNTWYVMNLLMDVFDSILSTGSPNNGFEEPCLSKRYGEIYAYILNETPFLDSLVDLLHLAEQSLPKRNKLKDFMEGVGSRRHNKSPGPNDQTTNSENQSEPHNGTPEDNISDIYANPYRHLEFPLIKGKLIFLIGLFTSNNRTVQDKMRETRTLEVILSNMMIDMNNPFIKENSVLTLSALLKNNQENQAIIANLEHQGVVKEETLEKAGYEVEFVDGNMTLKNNNK